jgi:hypothetical protein
MTEHYVYAALVSFLASLYSSIFHCCEYTVEVGRSITGSISWLSIPAWCSNPIIGTVLILVIINTIKILKNINLYFILLFICRWGQHMN